MKKSQNLRLIIISLIFSNFELEDYLQPIDHPYISLIEELPILFLLCPASSATDFWASSKSQKFRSNAGTFFNHYPRCNRDYSYYILLIHIFQLFLPADRSWYFHIFSANVLRILSSEGNPKSIIFHLLCLLLWINF